MASSLGAQLQSRLMEVDAELLSLNVVGLRLIALCWKVCVRRLNGLGPPCQHRLEHLERLRDKIREECWSLIIGDRRLVVAVLNQRLWLL